MVTNIRFRCKDSAKFRLNEAKGKLFHFCWCENLIIVGWNIK